MEIDLRLNRRTILSAALGSLAPAGFAVAQTATTRPVVSEAECPLQVIRPIAKDGHLGLAVMRKPPGPGPFPAILFLHGNLATQPLSQLEARAREASNISRFLAAGYVVVAPTYRSRDVDPQSTVSREDSLAVVRHVRTLPYVDPESIVVFGCSGGGDLALEVAARTKIAAVVPEEPASILMAGVFNTDIPKKGALYTPQDASLFMENPRKYYTPKFKKILRRKLSRIKCPILIIEGGADSSRINRWNADILIPELRSAKKMLTVNSYPEQIHCFCLNSGQPRGMPSPASAPAEALRAFQDIDAFCRRYLKTQPRQVDARLVTYVAALP